MTTEEKQDIFQERVKHVDDVISLLESIQTQDGDGDESVIHHINDFIIPQMIKAFNEVLYSIPDTDERSLCNIYFERGGEEEVKYEFKRMLTAFSVIRKSITSVQKLFFSCYRDKLSLQKISLLSDDTGYLAFTLLFLFNQLETSVKQNFTATGEIIKLSKSLVHGEEEWKTVMKLAERYGNNTYCVCENKDVHGEEEKPPAARYRDVLTGKAVCLACVTNVSQ